MAIKKLTLTQEHLLLIQNIDFHPFEFGEQLAVEPIINALDSIDELDTSSQKKLGHLESALFDLKNRLNEFNDEASQHAWGINQWNMFGGTFVMEDVAMITGHYGEFIEENGTMGKVYPKELEDHMWELYLYIYNNLTYIMKLVLWSISNGGLTPGTYKTKDMGINWTKEE